MSNTITITRPDGSEQSLQLYQKYSYCNVNAPEADKIIDLRKTGLDGARSIIVLKRLRLEENKLPVSGWNFNEVRCRETVSELRQAFKEACIEMPLVLVPMKVRLVAAKNLMTRKP